MHFDNIIKSRADGGSIYSRMLLVFALSIGLLLLGCGTANESQESPEDDLVVSVSDDLAARSEETQDADPPELVESGDADQEEDADQDEDAGDTKEGDYEVVESAAAAESEDELSYAINGALSMSYRARSGNGGNDEDLYGYLSLDGGNPAVNDVTFHAYGRATFDLDNDEDEANQFFSLNDTFGNQLDLKLYEAFFELRRGAVPTSLGMQKIRIGRQNIHAGYTYLVDGGRIDFEPIESFGNLKFGVYGGVPQYLYDSSRSGDWLVGGDASFALSDSTRFKLRYVHAEEDNDFNGADLDDDYFSVTARQRLGDNLHVTAEWNALDFVTRDVRLALLWDLPESDLSVRIRYQYQNEIQREYTTVYDPYTAVLGDSFAHHQADIQISKLFGEHFGLDVGFTGRFLEDASEAPFNREFIRGWVTLSTYRWPCDELSIALTGEFWAADHDQSVTAGGEIVWRPTDDLRFTVGSYYSMFKYDLFVVDEREDATTIFLRARWQATDSLRLDARYEFETGDEGDFHTVWAGFTWRF